MPDSRFPVRVPSPPAIDLRALRTRTGSSSSQGRGYAPPLGDPRNTDQENLDALRMVLTDEQYKGILDAIYKRGNFLPMPFTAGTTAMQLLPTQTTRYYLMLLNTSQANQLFFGFDFVPDVNGNGFTVDVNLGFYEPWVVPTNSISVVAGGAGTTGILLAAF